VIFAVGGRRTATGLLRAGLVGDVYLDDLAGGGRRAGNAVLRRGAAGADARAGQGGPGAEAGVRFEHFLVGGVPI
jgi:hypothetical protein